ncbi:hypothetical protein AB3464_18835 [Pseudomonas asplenii]|uniref:hypothetical protein n=1 Tax=Pseudomonas asplenii TaxID=53407 RepID=UPI0037C618E9
MIRVLLLGCFLLLGACANRLPLPVHTPTLALPLQLLVEREQDGVRQDWLLVIQREADGLRWSLMDPLGIPLARQLLQNGDWRADGLLPPNPQARELFAALLFALTPQAELAGNYPTAHQQAGQRELGEQWHVSYRQPLFFRLDLPQGLHYNISPLNESAP